MKPEIILVLGQIKLSIVLILLFALQVKGQNKETFQTWLDYKHQNKLNGNWIFFSDYGFRYSDIGQDAYIRLNARPSVKYIRNTNRAFLGGLGLFYKDNFLNVNTFEIRPWQGYELKWPSYKRFKFVHYFRLEQRVLESLEGQESTFNLKFRYRIGMEIPLNNPVISVGTYYVPVSFEIFEDLARSNAQVTTNRIRIVGGIGYRFTQDLRVKVIYTYQGTRSIVDKSVQQADHILRISVSQDFGFD